MDENPSSPAKRALIRRFLAASGSQAMIDSGSFLDRLAMPGGVLSGATPGEQSLQDYVMGPLVALKQAYQKHRGVWQQEYEAQVDGMFGDEELSLIVDFLESPPGRRYLDARWRMDAYIETNTEQLVEQIVSEAQVILRGGG